MLKITAMNPKLVLADVSDNPWLMNPFLSINKARVDWKQDSNIALA